jgi:phospholipid/cholesterol/gamma-HCH transport system substrate-binding protein
VRTPLDSIERRTGAFLVAVAGIVVGLIGASVGRSGLLGALRPRLLLYAMAEDSAGVAVGSPVRLHDVEIGSVSAVGFATRPEYPGSTVQITLKIEPDAARLIGSDAVAIVGGGMAPFVIWGVTLKTNGGPRITSGTYIKGQVLPSLMGDAGGMMVDVRRILLDLDAVLLNLAKLTQEMSQGKGIATRILSSEKLADDVEGIVREAREATGELRRLSAAAANTAPEIPGMVGNLQQAGTKALSIAAKADTALDSLPTMLATVERTLAKTEEAATALRTIAVQAPDVMRKTTAMVDDAHRIVQALERNVFVRSTLSERPQLTTEATIRPAASPPPTAAPTPSR